MQLRKMVNLQQLKTKYMEFNVYKEEFVLSCEEAIEQLEKFKDEGITKKLTVI